MNLGCWVQDQLNTSESTAPYIIGRELNLRKLPGRQWESNPQPSEQLRPMTIKTSASTEAATTAYSLDGSYEGVRVGSWKGDEKPGIIGILLWDTLWKAAMGDTGEMNIGNKRSKNRALGHSGSAVGDERFGLTKLDKLGSIWEVGWDPI